MLDFFYRLVRPAGHLDDNMEQDSPSLTANRVAMIRAAHQILDNPKVLDDPIALKIIGVRVASEIRAAPEKFETPVSRYLRAFVVARSRYTEDELSEAVKRGVGQYVILGAGLDTFAYRNQYPSSMLRIFEVDHPATQTWKRKRLDEAGIPIPQSLTFVPIDFERQTLADQLRKVGFSTEEPSFFSWLGVTTYLTRDAVMTTMKYIASSTPSGSTIVFDYAIPPSSLSPAHQLVFQALAHRVAAIEEPWQSFFDPHSLVTELRTMGFAHAEDIGPEELNMRFFNNRADRLSVGSLVHLMKALL
jgi:methyltransferase (TIGR00027 family)